MEAHERIVEALQSDKLDRCIALQSQSSGMVNARMTELKKLNEIASTELSAMKQDLADGTVLARQIKYDLQQLQTRIRKCQEQLVS